MVKQMESLARSAAPSQRRPMQESLEKVGRFVSGEKCNLSGAENLQPTWILAPGYSCACSCALKQTPLDRLSCEPTIV